MYMQNERGKRTDQRRVTGFGGGCHCKMTALALALIERAYPCLPRTATRSVHPRLPYLLFGIAAAQRGVT